VALPTRTCPDGLQLGAPRKLTTKMLLQCPSLPANLFPLNEPGDLPGGDVRNPDATQATFVGPTSSAAVVRLRSQDEPMCLATSAT
jgi:hypothetical protein